MARLRTIKPEYWTDEKVGECSPPARLLFIACWNFADDYGGLGRSAKELKAQAFPYDVIDCEPLIQELLHAGLLIEYTSDAKKYLHIKGFSFHQKVEKKGKPRVPRYEESGNAHRVILDSSTTTRVDLATESSLVESSLVESRKEEEVRAAKPRASLAKRIPEDFTLTAERKATAEAEHVDAEREFASFTDYWKAASGAKARKHDWDATWRNWCRRAADFKPNGGKRAEEPKITWRPPPEEEESHAHD